MSVECRLGIERGNFQESAKLSFERGGRAWLMVFACDTASNSCQTYGSCGAHFKAQKGALK